MEPKTADTQVAATTEQAPDIREQMLADVEKIDTEEVAETQDAGQPTEIKAEESEESDKEDKEDEEKSDDKEDEADKPAKPNRYQRLKARAEAAAKLAEKHGTERDEAVKIANIYRNRFLAIQQQYQKLVESNGIQISPEADENFRLKQAQRERELAEDFDRKNAEQRALAEAQAEKQALSEQFTSEALSLAGKSGLTGKEARDFAREVLVSFSMMRNAGDTNITMKDIAVRLRNLRTAQSSSENISRQREANATAPRPIGGKKGANVDYPATREGMAAFVESLTGKV